MFWRILLWLVVANGVTALLGIFVGFAALGKTFVTSLNVVLMFLVAAYVAPLTTSPRLGRCALVVLGICAAELMVAFVAIWFEPDGDLTGRVFWTLQEILALAVIAAFLVRHRLPTRSGRWSAFSAFGGAAVIDLALIAVTWGWLDLDSLANQFLAAVLIITVTATVMLPILARMQARAPGAEPLP